MSDQMTECRKCLTCDTVNPAIKSMQYVTRGPVAVRAEEIEKELKQDVKGEKPYKEVINASTEDLQAIGQMPITYIRQVLALVTLPQLLDDTRFPKDVKKRAEDILAYCGGSVGSYSNCHGLELIRRDTAEYIKKRDGGVPSDWQNIFQCEGASDGIRTVLKLLVADVEGKPPGVMVPVPQYPLYSAIAGELGIQQVGYYLNEEGGWSIDSEELERAYHKGYMTCLPRAIVIINPGNPTAQVLSRGNIESIIKFAYKYRLFLFADEVYQGTVLEEGCKFYSFKKVLIEMGPPYSRIELASFMSPSKGYVAECGPRGGYAEVINLEQKVETAMKNCILGISSPTVLGQTVLGCLVSPPQPADPSYDMFQDEKNAILNSLAFKAKMVTDALNNITGISCTKIQGSTHAFPQVKLPKKAISKAAFLGQCPSTFYAFQLLEKTGVWVEPGTSFGEKPGTYHFRVTLLPQVGKLKRMLLKLKEFHLNFMNEYT